MTDGGAETLNIAALPAIARLGACESARGSDADRHVKLLIQFAVEGSLSGAYSQPTILTRSAIASVVAKIYSPCSSSSK
jgi:hypothetical protein